MSELDKEIRSALGAAEENMEYDPSREDTLREMMAQSFRGRTRWMAVVAWVDSLVFTALAVFAAVQFFRVDEIRQMILYAAVFGLASAIVLFVKLWYWMLMNRNSIKREVKRLELRIAALTEKLATE